MVCPLCSFSVLIASLLHFHMHILLQIHWPPCWSCNTPSLPLPQRFGAVRFSLHTHCSFPRCSHDSCTCSFIPFSSLLKYHLPRRAFFHLPVYTSTSSLVFSISLIKGLLFPPHHLPPSDLLCICLFCAPCTNKCKPQNGTDYACFFVMYTPYLE